MRTATRVQHLYLVCRHDDQAGSVRVVSAAKPTAAAAAYAAKYGGEVYDLIVRHSVDCGGC